MSDFGGKADIAEINNRTRHEHLAGRHTASTRQPRVGYYIGKESCVMGVRDGIQAARDLAARVVHGKVRSV